MSLSSAAVAQAAAFPLPALLPPPALAHRSVVIVAADWRRYGRNTGPIRNRRLLEQALVEA